MNRSLDKIIRLIDDHKEKLRLKYKVKEIGIFGSFARGEQRKRSDVDIFVDFKEKDIPDLLTLIEIEMYFEKLLKMKVDLGLKRSIRKELKEGILKEAIYL